MTEYTIEITSYCPHKCNYCSSNATVNGYHLSVDTIIEFLDNATENDRINISGGEPLSHPKFYYILEYCKTKTKDVWVYSNAIEQIRYNTSVVKEIKCEANVCLVPGEEIYIPENADKVHLLKLIPQGRAKEMKLVDLKLSGSDCKVCNHKVLQADGNIVDAPCHKKY